MVYKPATQFVYIHSLTKRVIRFLIMIKKITLLCELPINKGKKTKKKKNRVIFKIKNTVRRELNNINTNT